MVSGDSAKGLYLAVSKDEREGGPEKGGGGRRKRRKAGGQDGQSAIPQLPGSRSRRIGAQGHLHSESMPEQNRKRQGGAVGS